MVAEKIHPGDRRWPEKLHDLGKRMPKELWFEGGWDLKLFTHCVAVIGSRRITEYGRRVVDQLVPRLVEDGFTIVSGMMYGTDQAAHKTALECGGKTVGVMGWGINYAGIADEDKALGRRITESGGLIISEWEKQAGTLWTFPQRDRIMAALAEEIYVVEAADRSGALITADWGIKLGRRIKAVPGPVTSKVSEGTNRLLADGKAEAWTGWKTEIGPRSVAKRDTVETEIYRLIENETLSADEISRKTGISVDKVGAKLTMMVIAGEVKENDGKYHL
jgi:DNA processing protein